MRSGNGRHRRPRQVPALVVTAGVTGSALALPLLAATSATAADTSTWDAVAECESGGTWSANFGSGAYGGLQFTQEQWQSAGGLDFAERADLASRSQQIAVAERVLASQGPQAWPLCAASAGLTQQGPAPEVDPGLPGGTVKVAPSPGRPDASVPAGGQGAPATDFGAPTPSPGESPSFAIPDGPLAPSSGLPVMPAPDLPTTADPSAPVSPQNPDGSTAPVDPTAPADPTTPAPSPDPSAPADPAAPTGDPTAPAVPGASPDPSSSAVPLTSPDASVPVGGGGKHRGTPAVEAPAASDPASDPTYTVKAGDSLTAIADAKGLKGGWNALYQANEQVIGGDADLIKPGQNLDLTK
ncbi:transglycosylase family protein [Streptomyces xanthophaeus]|uniref:transglycosylase family protein n=1 Tax=Streptomyces xanthophaeus TaxID=67385 RepID=UPI0038660618|nr:transglycosylase family protein [Streptomyces xanthophaeus]WST62115.1 transglycosylase family protein [Streptomyces xanthophaeus]